MDYYINLIYSLFAFIIGTLFGSFFTLATYRIPRHQDITHTRSYCPNCKHKLGFFDCFPILSYVSTLGRCRYCHKPISVRYPLIELASGFYFLLVYLIFGFTWEALLLIVCFIYAFLVFGVDIMAKKMTAKEKKEVEELIAKKKEEKSEKKNKKAGAVNIDIVVAVIIFVVFFVSTIFITRNYNSTLVEYTRKSNALNLCLNKINEEKSKRLENISSASETVTIDNVDYDCDIEVLPYIKDGDTTVENAKVITSKVTFLINGIENEVSLRCIKVED